MQYSFTCQQGHEPVTFTADADNEDAAVETILSQTRDHLLQAHPDMVGSSDDDLKNMIRGGLQQG